MKVLLLNPPYPKRVMRRWVASYHAPNFLNPPLELMGLGAILRRWKGREDVRLIDAIALGWDEERGQAEVARDQPELLVTLAGFNTFPRDLACLNRIAARFPALRIALFGYLPTQFPDQVLARSGVHYVIRDEPELIFSELYDALLARSDDLSGVRGLAWKDAAGGIHVNPERGRQAELDALPFADHSLVQLELYNESYLERPIGTIMSERGCPYRCNYCVRTFGEKLYSRSADSILAEIEALRRDHGIRNLRFMDDTFTLNRARTLRLCEGLVERGLDVAWTCLTRVDTVDAELLSAMKRAGCRRMYVGVESGSQRVLDYYKKGLTLDKIRRQMAVIRDSGVECSVFFIVGAPIETDEDVSASIALACELDLDYVIVTKTQYWPGTGLFAEAGGQVDFDPFAERELVYRPPNYDRVEAWQRRFYREFYFRPRYFAKRFGTLLRSPRDTLVGFGKLVAYTFGPRTSDDFI